MGEKPEDGIIRFGIFELDTQTRELRRNGMLVRLQDQPIQVLLALVEKPGELVTREELCQRIWGDDTFVDFDHGLSAAVNRLREGLSDSADNPRFVQTLPKRGYRFIAPVEGFVKPAATPAGDDIGLSGRLSGSTFFRGPLLWSIALAATLACSVAVLLAINGAGLRDRLLKRGSAVPKIESIAVLPLENLSRDPDQEYFADGMTEALITNLGGISALRVISRQSVMHYKGSKKTLQEIARELGADALVEGTVQRSGDRIRITAQLVHGKTDRHLWAESYDRDFRDVLSLQSEVARSVASEIRVAVTPEEQRRLEAFRQVDPDAYRLYLQGRYQMSKRTLPAFEKSIGLFRQVLEGDPRNALAYAGLSESYGLLPWYGGAMPKAAYPQARAAAQKALEIDSTLAEAHAAPGVCALLSRLGLAGCRAGIQVCGQTEPELCHRSPLLRRVSQCDGTSRGSDCRSQARAGVGSAVPVDANHRG